MHEINYGEMLARFRRKKGMTQQELAEHVDCALSTISRIETGIELPRRDLFEKFNRVFEVFGITYEELEMEEAFEFKRAKDELLRAIHCDREDEIEKKLLRFKELMDENNSEHKQYCILAYLIYMRKKGLSIEEFLDRSNKLLTLNRNLPSIEEIKDIHLTKIEHMIIYQMGVAHMRAGNDNEAMEIMETLAKNGLKSCTEYHRNRSKSVSYTLAKILVKKNDLDRAKDCIAYVIKRVIESYDTRLLFHSLVLQSELFVILGNKKGAKLIDDFLESAEHLVKYLNHYFKKEGMA